MTEKLPFAHLMDLEPEDVLLPNYAVLAYAVCAMEQESCGWGGWILESVLRATNEAHYFGTGDMPLPAYSRQICPRCGRVTFRTFSYRFNIGDKD